MLIAVEEVEIWGCAISSLDATELWSIPTTK